MDLPARHDRRSRARRPGVVGFGSIAQVIDGRIAFQTETKDAFTEVIEALTHRKVVAFLSANQATPGVACELFFLDATSAPTGPRSASAAG